MPAAFEFGAGEAGELASLPFDPVAVAVLPGLPEGPFAEAPPEACAPLLFAVVAAPAAVVPPLPVVVCCGPVVLAEAELALALLSFGLVAPALPLLEAGDCGAGGGLAGAGGELAEFGRPASSKAAKGWALWL